MKLGIYVNQRKAASLPMTEKITAIADRYGFVTSILADAKGQTTADSSAKALEFAQNNDVILVLGGDGTILRIASAAARCGVPLLSVNLGHLGFLTELEPEELEEGLRLLAAGQYTVEERMMLSCRANGQEYLALNDVCLQRASRARLLKFTCYAGEELVDSLAADGVLVASPTGSTAYSLSCGGPIVSPKLSLLLMTPICAHTLRARPFVFRDDELLSFNAQDEIGFSVTCDGVQLHSLDGIRHVEISRFERPLQIINFKQKSFFKRLNQKLFEWNFSKE